LQQHTPNCSLVGSGARSDDRLRSVCSRSGRADLFEHLCSAHALPQWGHL
jgi:hypothetical protein